MGAPRSPHSRRMIHRAILSLAVSTALVGCVETTNLGAAELASTPDEAGTPGYEFGKGTPDSGSGSGSGVTASCAGYTWDPVPAAEPCRYLLPEGPTTGVEPYPQYFPQYFPRTWDPERVQISVGHPGQPDADGFFKMSSDECGGADGWFYVDAPPDADGGAATDADAEVSSDAGAADARTPTHFEICPKSCAAVESGAELRLTSWLFCAGAGESWPPPPRP
jgi:hypothetical protein